MVYNFNTSFSFPANIKENASQIMALGAFCTADASLIVFLIGPEKSRPFTMAFHATIGRFHYICSSSIGNHFITFTLHYITFALHLLLFYRQSGAGFLAATFLVRPFLPNSEETSPDEICGRVFLFMTIGTPPVPNRLFFF